MPVEAAATPRVTGTWWCSCGKCRQMPTEDESMCCTEWDLLVTEEMGNLNVSRRNRGLADLRNGPTPYVLKLRISEHGPGPCSYGYRNRAQDLIRRPVIETFFYVPKPNWRRRPTPEGVDGQLSASDPRISRVITPDYRLLIMIIYITFTFRQCRLVSYRVVLEWALKGEVLGCGNRVTLPSCVMWAIRAMYPSPTEEYAGFKDGEIEAVF
ncbi:hypothetical protein N1851_006531 [Merluccius polli]|uniref:P2X purinoreceptor 7 intracellular domain-containing protein n=1 Tax=Merluccius polli TaxID=89951 RepID=A0AA47N5I6_MERPO|nr:hypothetical protein N1851_006531 [Merluccius polli]